jgi:hypothetical protein
MTSPDQTVLMIETIVSDLWRSFFETIFDALHGTLRRLGAQRLRTDRVRVCLWL